MVGTRCQLQLCVDEPLTVSRSALAAEFRTVGTHVDVSRAAATPGGITVTADAKLISVEGRKLGFLVRCIDEAGPIGEGRHQRAIATRPSSSSAGMPSRRKAMFDGFSSRKVSVGDVEISCVVGGSGPPVLLLHGFPQNKAMWARVAPKLASNYTLVCADLRGYGDSSKPRGLADRSNYSFRAMAGDQLGLMRALGFDRFHLIGHDRGGRTGHRLVLDHPHAVLSLTVMDIVPTYTMFMDTNRRVAGSYWHWYFLSQPEPFPERLIGNDPDFFYETCLVGWGAAKISDFDREMLADYRRSWRDPAMIHGSCSDYRAAASIDLEHDAADIDRKVECPTLVFYGSSGQMAQLFDIPSEWRKRFKNAHHASLPGGHFFVDQFPDEVARTLGDFLASSQNSLKAPGRRPRPRSPG